jgi:hypothetical protein
MDLIVHGVFCLNWTREDTRGHHRALMGQPKGCRASRSVRSLSCRGCPRVRYLASWSESRSSHFSVIARVELRGADYRNHSSTARRGGAPVGLLLGAAMLHQ